MNAKLFILFVTLMCANALNLKLEAFDSVEDNLLKADEAVTFDPKAVSTVTYFTGVARQQLVGQALDQVIPTGAQKLRLTFTAGAVGPSRVSQVIAYVNLPPSHNVQSALVYTRQFDKNFTGEIILNYQLNTNAYLSWYVYAV